MPDPLINPDPPAGRPSEDERAAQVARIFREHNRILIGLLVSRLQNEQDAKEVAQEAYVKVLQLEGNRGAIGYLRSYLFKTAENLAVDRLRQRRSRLRIDQLDSPETLFEEARAEKMAIAAQELELLRTAVAELPGRCREAFRLHKLEERPPAEVAALMNVSERMVRKFIGRALAYIRLRREGQTAANAKVMCTRD